MLHPDYFVATYDDGVRPHRWRWEIGRRSTPMGVRLGGSGCQSRLAAEFAGKRALKEFLAALGAEEARIRLEEGSPKRPPAAIARRQAG